MSQSLGQTLGQIPPILAAVAAIVSMAKTATLIVGLVLLALIMALTSLPGPLQTPGYVIEQGLLIRARTPLLIGVRVHKTDLLHPP